VFTVFVALAKIVFMLGSMNCCSDGLELGHTILIPNVPLPEEEKVFEQFCSV
jgi:hypothetical protein